MIGSATRKSLPLLMKLVLLLLIALVSGCGFDWLPAFERQPTDPDQFSFPSKTGQPLNTPVTSDAITVAGLTADSSPITITGPVSSNSQYSINGGTATTAQGTVKNGDKVTVTQTTGAAPGQTITSTLSIGRVSANFSTTTALISATAFSAPTVVAGGFVQAFTTITSQDTGTLHQISIKDSGNTGQAQFSVADTSGNPTFFTNVPQAVAVLNNMRIYVRNTQTNVTNGVTTTLTIDNVELPVPLQ